MTTAATAAAVACALAVAVAVLVGVVLAAPRPPVTAEAFAAAHYDNKRSSCFDCERDFPPEERWRAQPSKCFSCERQLAATPGADPFTASRTVWR